MTIMFSLYLLKIKILRSLKIINQFQNNVSSLYLTADGILELIYNVKIITIKIF